MPSNIHISFKGHPYIYEYSDMTTLKELRNWVHEKTGIAPEYQKLLAKQLSTCKSGDAHDEMTLESLSIADGMKIMLVGSTEEQVRGVIDRPARTPLKPARPYKDRVDPTSLRYSFGSIEVLTNSKYIRQDYAREFMNKLTNDLGVKEIMKHYQWGVFKLIELCPIESPSILGYNRNKGDVIALRLRTDDLSGFRAYNAVRATLLHELTHMVHSEHDHRFWSLNRILAKEVISRNWTKTGGYKLSNKVFAPSMSGNDGTGFSGSSYTGGTFVLGGDAVKPNPITNSSDLTEEELEALNSCGNR